MYYFFLHLSLICAFFIATFLTDYTSLGTAPDTLIKTSFILLVIFTYSSILFQT